MNLVSLFLLILISFTMLEGIYRGFMHSIINLGAFFLSIITSFIFSPLISSAVRANDRIFSFMLYYTEGAEKIAVFKDTSLPVATMSADKLQNIIAQSNLTEPFGTLIHQNVTSSAFSSEGLTTIGEYYNMTIVCTVLNILSFLLMFLAAYIIYTFVLGMVNYTIKFPELRQYDRFSGASFGIIRGFMICFLIIMIVPVIFLLLPVDQISDYFYASKLGVFFYNNNFFLHLIRGIA